MNPYDEVAYKSSVAAQTHPDGLATVATLRGLSPAHPLRCRMLDLACGDGMNMLACAQAAAQSEFVGVDLAAGPVARGNEIAAEAGLANVRILEGDFTAPDPAWGTFDYVVAHGVYSWVAAEARERMMATIAATLRRGGVACVRYRVKPGSIARDLVRNLLLLHTESAETTDEKLKQAYEFLRFLRAARNFPGEPYDDWLRAELESRLATPPSVLRHDDLAEVNEAVWYRDFAAQAARHGLACLGDAEWSQDTDVACPESVRSAVFRHADPVEREQYRDLIRFRRMRQTLLVHREDAAGGGKRADRIPALLVSARLRLAGPALPLAREGEEAFQSARSGEVRTAVRVVRAACHLLIEAWPRRIPFEDLVTESARRVAAACEAGAGSGTGRDPEARATDADRTSLLQLVDTLHDGGIVELHTHEPDCAREGGERPVATPLARAAARRGTRIVSVRQLTIDLVDPRPRRIIQLLDGTLDRAEVLRRLAAEESGPAALPREVPALTAEVVDTWIARLAHWGVLLS